MSALRLLLAGALAAVGLVALTPATAHACFCLTGGDRQQVQRSDAVFTGTFTRFVEAAEYHQGYQFEVHEVFSGEVAATSDVQALTACGLERMEVGSTYLVLANRRDGVLTSGLCSGTGLADPARIASVEEITGPGLPPQVDAATIVAALLAFLAWPT